MSSNLRFIAVRIDHAANSGTTRIPAAEPAACAEPADLLASCVNLFDYFVPN
jgi:hypothetical protein